MQIISILRKEQVLVRLTKEELAHVIGKNSPYDIRNEFLNQAIDEATNIGISEIYYKHNEVCELQNNLVKAKERLSSMIGALTKIEDLTKIPVKKINDNK